MESAETPFVFVLDDFNADNIQSDSVFGTAFVEFCNVNKIDKMRMINVYFLLVLLLILAHGTTSWLDHCITTAAGPSIISDTYITDNVVCSDHFLLTVNVL